MGSLLGISKRILDARDSEKIPLCDYLLGMCIRACSVSSIRLFLYTVCVDVLYTVGVVVYMSICMLYTMGRIVILFILCVLIRVGGLLGVFVMCCVYCIVVCICIDRCIEVIAISRC